MSHVKTDKLSARTASGTITLGESGETLTVPSGVVLTNNGTATGFSEPAYAANASASTGAVNVDASDNLQFDSGYGSTATAYGCRAWVNFNGTGTVAIRDSGNVSSITDLGTADHQVNFATAMPDANYAATVSHVGNTSANWSECVRSLTTTSVEVIYKFTSSGSSTLQADDRNTICVMVVR
jgi:hypothetical protein